MKSQSLAKKIKSLRIERAWSQAQLAEIASLSIRTVQRVEVDGKCSHESLLSIASAFDIEVKKLTVFHNETNAAKFSISLFNVNVNFNWFESRTAIVAGLLMVFPALYFISASLLKSGLGISFFFDPLEIFFSSADALKIFNFISPFVFLFGLAGAFLINLLVMFSIRMWKENGAIKSDISFKPVPANVLISFLSVSTLALLLLYAFAENFGGK